MLVVVLSHRTPVFPRSDWSSADHIVATGPVPLAELLFFSCQATCFGFLHISMQGFLVVL